MKGAILSINPATKIVDITHQIPPQDIEAAAFNLLSCYRAFPADTIHVAVVDPGVGSNRKAIVVECANQFFVGPDNGLFSWICEREGNYQARQLTSEKFFRQPVSSTFHGRDLFAPVAAHLSTAISPSEFGPAIAEIVSLAPLQPQIGDAEIEGRILHIDHFGNCITNLRPEHFGGRLGAGASLSIKEQRVNIFREFFAQKKSQSSEKLFMILGSAGFVEIAAEKASAAALLDCRRGDRVSVSRQ